MIPIKKRVVGQIAAKLPPRGWIVIAGPSDSRLWAIARELAYSKIDGATPLPEFGGTVTASTLRILSAADPDPKTGTMALTELGDRLGIHDQRRAPGVLMKAYPNVRFIVPTQNPFLCQAASPGGLIVCPTDAEPYIADERLYNRVTTGSVDDVMLALYGLDHTWSDAANEKRQRLAALEARLLAGKASPDERAEFNALRNRLAFHGAEEVEQATARYLAARERRSR